MKAEKLRQVFDRKSFIFITCVFFGTFGAGLAFSVSELRDSNIEGLGELIIQEEDFSQTNGLLVENGLEHNSQDVLAQEKEEVTTEETFIQEKESLSRDSVNLQGEAKTVISQLIESLGKGDSSSLYDLLGEDLQGTFGKEGVSQAILGGLGIERVEVLSGPQVSGEWMECMLKLTFTNGTFGKYIAVFHWENGEWKLFGTEEI